MVQVKKNYVPVCGWTGFVEHPADLPIFQFAQTDSPNVSVTDSPSLQRVIGQVLVLLFSPFES